MKIGTLAGLYDLEAFGDLLSIGRLSALWLNQGRIVGIWDCSALLVPAYFSPQWPNLIFTVA
jgi:hypothetical protein